VDKGGVMPNYTFRNKKTDETITVNMTMTEHETYLDDKPDWEQMILAANFVDPVSIGITKPPSDFQKYVLGRVKASVPQAEAVASKRWDIPKEF
jgi:hypothetical protein